MVILLTGASSGIGYETARTLALRGHKVWGAARRVEQMEPLREFGVVPLRMDVSDEESVRQGVGRVLETEGRIDVLINNAGYGYFGAMETVPMEEARRQLEVNLFGLVHLVQLVLPQMRQRRSGRIINVASVAGRVVLPFGGWYHVSKFSVEALSDALRTELKPFGIKVSIIEPGGIKTAWGKIAADNLDASTRGTVYEEAASREANIMRIGYDSNLLSKPQVIAKAIRKAVESGRPRVRYHCGFGASIMLVMHALMPARWWDALMRAFMSLKLK